MSGPHADPRPPARHVGTKVKAVGKLSPPAPPTSPRAPPHTRTRVQVGQQPGPAAPCLPLLVGSRVQRDGGPVSTTAALDLDPPAAGLPPHDSSGSVSSSSLPHDSSGSGSTSSLSRDSSGWQQRPLADPWPGPPPRAGSLGSRIQREARSRSPGSTNFESAGGGRASPAVAMAGGAGLTQPPHMVGVTEDMVRRGLTPRRVEESRAAAVATTPVAAAVVDEDVFLPASAAATAGRSSGHGRSSPTSLRSARRLKFQQAVAGGGAHVVVGGEGEARATGRREGRDEGEVEV